MNARIRWVAIGWLGASLALACGGDQKKPSEFPDPIPPDPVPEVPASAEPAASGGEAPRPDAPPADPKATAKDEAPKRKSLGAITTDGGVGEDAVTQSVEGVTAGAESCHEGYWKKSPQGAGELTVAVVLTKNGKVKSLSVKSKTLKDKALAKCLTQAFRSATWPAPSGKKAKVSFVWTLPSKG